MADSANTLAEHKGKVGGWIDGHGIAPFNKLILFYGLLAIALAPNTPGFLLIKKQLGQCHEILSLPAGKQANITQIYFSDF